MAGQYLDLLEQAIASGSVERAWRVIRFKSAKYTIEGPLLWARRWRAGPELVTAYSAAGMPWVRRSNCATTSWVSSATRADRKPAGDDLREGKRTVLVATAIDRATPVQAAVITRHLGDERLDAEGVATLRDVIEATGALSHVESLIADCTLERWQHFDTDVIADPLAQVLRRARLRRLPAPCERAPGPRVRGPRGRRRRRPGRAVRRAATGWCRPAG